MSWLTDLLGEGITGAIGGMSLPSAASTALLLGAYGTEREALGDFLNTARRGIADISTQAQQGLTFRPFTVTSSTGGGVTTTPTGGSAFTLSPEEQALQQQLLGGAGGLFGQAVGDTAGREADVYERIRALQRPAEERQRLATEERLAAQGRLGLQSAAFGGTSPELLAQEQAIQQARQAASLSAIQQAQAEQAQAAELGQGMLASAYVPQASLLNVFQQGFQPAQLAAQMQQQAGLTGAELGMAGLNTQLGVQQARAGLTSGLLSSLAAQAAQAAQNAPAGGTTLSDAVPQWLKDILGI